LITDKDGSTCGEGLKDDMSEIFVKGWQEEGVVVTEERAGMRMRYLASIRKLYVVGKASY
jgi:hypothetical protein